MRRLLALALPFAGLGLPGAVPAADAVPAAAGPGSDGRIAFVDLREGNWDIYSINADGTDERRLTLVIAGRARVGRKLRLVRGASLSPPDAAATYRWHRNCKPIRRATEPGYRIRRKDLGTRLRLHATCTPPGGIPVTLVSNRKKVRR
ncbi:hypothetical protein FHP29_18425 [Nocardioides albidus]|uniref:Uncharacterized protein n=1 Tax=Nocardioides albidus TaxID=1517589 RepID=A0A5C4VKP1_9ACTN|nr:hypothetical protein [Nocardioides albidus]TNM36166.1 hypothetical protein FHP29_18425 [Nocardioides albidus]